MFVWYFNYSLATHTLCEATSFSHSPEIIQKGKLTFCCCRNSCYTHLLHLPLWCQTPVFTRNLPFTSSLPVFRHLAFQAARHLEILDESTLCTEAILKLSSCCEHRTASLIAISSHIKSGHFRQEGEFSPDPQPMLVRGLVIIVLQLN